MENVGMWVNINETGMKSYGLCEVSEELERSMQFTWYNELNDESFPYRAGDTIKVKYLNQGHYFESNNGHVEKVEGKFITIKLYNTETLRIEVPR